MASFWCPAKTKPEIVHEKTNHGKNGSPRKLSFWFPLNKTQNKTTGPSKQHAAIWACRKIGGGGVPSLKMHVFPLASLKNMFPLASMKTNTKDNKPKTAPRQKTSPLACARPASPACPEFGEDTPRTSSGTTSVCFEGLFGFQGKGRRQQLLVLLNGGCSTRMLREDNGESTRTPRPMANQYPWKGVKLVPKRVSMLVSVSGMF